MCKPGCWKRLLIVPIATLSLTGCLTAGSSRAVVVCPPVVEYAPALQARAAEELASLPAHSAIAVLLSDYAVMRDQARVCAGAGR